MMSESQGQSGPTSEPRGHATTIHVKVNEGKPNPGTSDGLQLNIEYFKTPPGIVKLIQLILGIVCMGCGSPALSGSAQWFLFVAVTCFISTLLWGFVYLLSIKHALKIPINWTLSELLYTLLAVILYIIAAIVELTSQMTFMFGRYIAAGIFGVANVFAYGFGFFYLYKEWKESRV